jgi:hypothetical protein
MSKTRRQKCYHGDYESMQRRKSEQLGTAPLRAGTGNKWFPSLAHVLASCFLCCLRFTLFFAFLFFSLLIMNYFHNVVCGNLLFI